MSDNSDDEADLFWQEVLDGKREPLNVLYVLNDVDPYCLESIEQWGEITGLYSIYKVKTVEQAIVANEKLSADVVVLCNCWVNEAWQFSQASPHTPICMAHLSGYSQFDFSLFPPQVISAQWIAPREWEFMESIATALGKVATEIIYKASLPRIELIDNVSEELLARLTKYPDERFILNPRLFEKTVAELLGRMGYEVKLTPRSGDKGRDIIACLQTAAAPVLMLVECKRYAPSRLVGPEPITRLWYRLFDDHANVAMVVTTSGYQPVAKKTATDRGYQISLKDGQDFTEWVKSRTEK